MALVSPHPTHLGLFLAGLLTAVSCAKDELHSDRETEGVELTPQGAECRSDDECSVPKRSCMAATCDEGQCAISPKVGASCDDGDACTQADTCNAEGVCVGSTPDPAPPGQCYIESSASCDDGVWTFEVDVGAPCDDGNACNIADTCQPDGSCDGSMLQVDCDEPPPCHTSVGATCTDVGGTPECIYPPDIGAACDDGDICTDNEACDANGECTGTPDDPASGNGGTCTERVMGTGVWHTCAIESAHGDGPLQCWGWNSHGQLGNGLGSGSDIARDVVGLPEDADVAQISGGTRHSCALLADGRVFCWGREDLLGQGTTAGSNGVHQVPGINDAIALNARGFGTCVIRMDGSVWCWGLNQFGQLGTGDTQFGWSPRQVVGITNARYIGVGRYNRCAITDDDELWCWGFNGKVDGANGGLSAPGEGPFAHVDYSSPEFYPTPQQIPAVAGLKQVEGGNMSICVSTESAGVWCRGASSILGLPSDGGTYGFTQVGDSLDIDTMAIAATAGCGITESDQVKCWGATGQIKTDNGLSLNPTAALVTFDAPAAIAGNGGSMCLMKEDSSAWCWGRNSRGETGQGDNGIGFVDVPTRVLP